jgi:hypothetical protein
MRDVTGGFRAVPDGLFRKRIARLARNCPFRHHYLFFFYFFFLEGFIFEDDQVPRVCSEMLVGA